jgi:hypothetical protein
MSITVHVFSSAGDLQNTAGVHHLHALTEKLAKNLTLAGELPLPLNLVCPILIQWPGQIHLSESVLDDLIHPDLFKSDDPNPLSARAGTVQ